MRRSAAAVIASEAVREYGPRDGRFGAGSCAGNCPEYGPSGGAPGTGGTRPRRMYRVGVYSPAPVVACRLVPGVSERCIGLIRLGSLRYGPAKTVIALRRMRWWLLRRPGDCSSGGRNISGGDSSWTPGGSPLCLASRSASSGARRDRGGFRLLRALPMLRAIFPVLRAPSVASVRCSRRPRARVDGGTPVAMLRQVAAHGLEEDFLQPPRDRPDHAIANRAVIHGRDGRNLRAGAAEEELGDAVEFAAVDLPLRPLGYRDHVPA